VFALNEPFGYAFEDVADDDAARVPLDLAHRRARRERARKVAVPQRGATSAIILRRLDLSVARE
jgi:hypothetical protein